MAMKVDVDTSAVVKRFTAMARRALNFRPVFRWAFQELQKAHLENFKTQGSTSGFPWKPLEPQYAAWKLENYGAHGILVREGTLEGSLTMNSSRGAVRDIGLTAAEFGTRVPYARFHHTGTRNMAKRDPIFVPRLMAERTGQAALEYVVHGTIGVVYAEALEGFVV